jgi:pyruvate/2-oxoglutarate dehydrogenase complex dihydrolipoamide dehydrogenase (E3) component
LPKSRDYDWVIIGSSIAALRAALAVVRQHQRVALVLESAPERATETATEATSKPTFEPTLVLTAQGEWQRQALFAQLEQGWSTPQLLAYSQQWAQQRAEAYAPAALAREGIDVVMGVGEFSQHPRLGLQFTVGSRQLRATRYLLAAHRQPESSLAQVLAEPWSQPFGRIEVAGNHPQACETADLLQRLGAQVALDVSVDNSKGGLLPLEDPVVIAQVEAQLEAVGVEIVSTHTTTDSDPPKPARRINGYPPTLAPNRWNLAGVGVTVNPAGIPVNAVLQTNHPQIYACGELLSGYAQPEIAQAEALWVVQRPLRAVGLGFLNLGIFNSHAFNSQTFSYQALPWVIRLSPPILRVGWSERQAQQYSGQAQGQNAPQTHRLSLDTSFSDTSFSLAGAFGHDAAMCQLVTARDGTMLGATLWGIHHPGQMAGMAQGLAMAIRQRCKLKAFLRSIETWGGWFEREP